MIVRKKFSVIFINWLHSNNQAELDAEEEAKEKEGGGEEEGTETTADVGGAAKKYVVTEKNQVAPSP